VNSKPCHVSLHFRTPVHIKNVILHLRTTYHFDLLNRNAFEAISSYCQWRKTLFQERCCGMVLTAFPAIERIDHRAPHVFGTKNSSPVIICSWTLHSCTCSIVARGSYVSFSTPLLMTPQELDSPASRISTPSRTPLTSRTISQTDCYSALRQSELTMIK
jgi:hypothetical protein